jgi:hypothetical protein
MVLAELGSKIQQALNKLNKTTVIDEEVLFMFLSDYQFLFERYINSSIISRCKCEICDKIKRCSQIAIQSIIFKIS